MQAGGNGQSTHLMFAKPPGSVVSLVPSITQSLLDLGCGQSLVGVTKYCPKIEGGSAVKVVGGTHAVDITTIIDLEPELVFANQEENDRADIEALEDAGIKVWVSFPKTVRDALQILWAIARLFKVMKDATARILLIERSLEWVERGEMDSAPKSVFVPIWQDTHPDVGAYWMTFNGETYCDSVLRTCGGANVFRDRQRKYPLDAEFDLGKSEKLEERDTRYPRVSADEVLQLAPDYILLPSEPYEFSAKERAEMRELLSDTPAIRNNRVQSIDGRWLSWHGTMLAHALVELPSVFS